MTRKKKQTFNVLLLTFGLGLLLYGLAFHVQTVFSKNNDKGLATVEAQLVLEVSRGGLKREKDGELHLTYTGKPPEACST